MTLVLGISTTHNGSVALIENGRVKVAIQAERISRTKRQILELSGDKEILQKYEELNRRGAKKADG